MHSFWLVVMLLAITVVHAEPRSSIAYYDSVEVSLLTCSPHEEIYSLYGHTALRYHDLHNNQDIVLNWGVFDFKTRFFVFRFVFGLTDYELGLIDYRTFCKYYRHWGSMITEQVLNFTPDEKIRLEHAVAKNLKPENIVYRYNFFYDNCSTRPRNIIEHAAMGRVEYTPRSDYHPTWRQMVHEKTARHKWATFGNDMLLGLLADQYATQREQEFLPENLLYDFDRAQIIGYDGTSRPLISERRMVVKPGVQLISPGFPLSPIECGVILTIVSLLVFAGEWKRRKTYKYWDATLMILTGIGGCMLFVMLFSQHPTTTLNLQLLLINPIHLFFLPAVLRRRQTRYWTVLIVMVVLFMIGRIFQHYAEGIEFLALCLLIRTVANISINKRKEIITHK